MNDTTKIGGWEVRTSMSVHPDGDHITIDQMKFKGDGPVHTGRVHLSYEDLERGLGLLLSSWDREGQREAQEGQPSPYSG